MLRPAGSGFQMAPDAPSCRIAHRWQRLRTCDTLECAALIAAIRRSLLNPEP